jgi:hypothetical protein
MKTRGNQAAYKLHLGAPTYDLNVELEVGCKLRLQVKTLITGTYQPTAVFQWKL